MRHEAAAVRTNNLTRRGATALAHLSAEDEARLYDQLGDPDRHPIVLLEVPGERAGEPGLEDLPALSLGDLAAWTYGLPLAPTTDEIENGLAQHQRDRLAAIDTALTLYPDELGRADRDLLQQALSDGLRDRYSHWLATHELFTYLHLLARGLDPRPFRVCERCLRVHKAPRANTCPDCRKSPPRPNPRPHHEKIFIFGGSPHRRAYQSLQGPGEISFRVSSQRPPITTTLLYISTCAQCGHAFPATAANIKYCPSHAATKERTARSRAARRGKKRADTAPQNGTHST